MSHSFVDSPTSKVVQVKVVNIVKGQRKTQFGMFCWSDREDGGGSMAIMLGSKTCCPTHQLWPGNYWEKPSHREEEMGCLEQSYWGNVSRPKADSTINQGRLMCRDANHIDSGIVVMLKEHGGQRLIAQLPKGAWCAEMRTT